MRYARLGDSGLIVSKFVWGTATVGAPTPEWAKAPHLDESAAREAVAIALDHGVNFFDTADHYTNGESEEILGRLLHTKRNHVVIATKVGMRTGAELTQSGLSRRHILASLEGSLRRLGTDWIDVYMAHRPDPYTPIEETLATFEDLVRSGKVRYIGYSNWPAWLAAKAVGLQRQNGWTTFRVAQMYYSLADRGLEHDTIPFCLDAGIGLMTWSPLAGGLLSGKYTRTNPDGGGGRLAHFRFGPSDREKGYAIVDVLNAIAANHSVTPAGIAMAWLAERPAVSTVLLGISRVGQLSENLKAASVALTAEDLTALDEVSQPAEPYPNWFNTIVADKVIRDVLTNGGAKTDTRGTK